MLQVHKGIWASSEREKEMTTSTILGAASNNLFFTSDQWHLSLIDFSCALCRGKHCKRNVDFSVGLRLIEALGGQVLFLMLLWQNVCC